jgi:hypothetical protein
MAKSTKTVKRLPAPKPIRKSKKQIADEKKAIRELNAMGRAEKKAQALRSQFIPEGHEVVDSTWLQGLINEREAYMKACERNQAELQQGCAVKEVVPQDAQNQIVSILTNFKPNLQNVILSCTLTVLKGYRTAAVDRANDTIKELNHQGLEAESVLNDATTCKQGFNELVTAAASELH